MADNHSKDIRSYNMAQIKSSNTTPELTVRKFLFSKGYRYRLHYKRLPGKPDIVLSKYRTVIFVHGCFWHGHAHCKYYVLPKSNKSYWISKIEKNLKRDIVNEKAIKELGWNVLTIWECQLRKDLKNITLRHLDQLLQLRLQLLS